VAYQQSFRCCGESNAAVVPAPRATPPVAVVSDAGPVPRTSSLDPNDEGADGGTNERAKNENERAKNENERAKNENERATADNTPPLVSDDDDEIGAIRKARVGLCSAAAGVGRNVEGDGNGSASVAAAAAAIAIVLLSTRRRAASRNRGG
jgi:hypothetical protein